MKHLIDSGKKNFYFQIVFLRTFLSLIKHIFLSADDNICSSFCSRNCYALLNSLMLSQVAPFAIITALLEISSTWWGPNHSFFHLFPITIIQSPISMSCRRSRGGDGVFSWICWRRRQQVIEILQPIVFTGTHSARTGPSPALFFLSK